MIAKALNVPHWKSLLFFHQIGFQKKNFFSSCYCSWWMFEFGQILANFPGTFQTLSLIENWGWGWGWGVPHLYSLPTRPHFWDLWPPRPCPFGGGAGKDISFHPESKDNKISLRLLWLICEGNTLGRIPQNFWSQFCLPTPLLIRSFPRSCNFFSALGISGDHDFVPSVSTSSPSRSKSAPECYNIAN